MVRIRLRRVGGKGQPSFRIVAADKEAPRDGRFLENLGYYNPRTHPATIQLKEDRIFEWLGKGAQPSDSVHKVFQSAGLWERYERFKKGEDLENLLAEAQAAEAARNINPKTSQATPTKKSKPAKSRKVKEPEELKEQVEAQEPSEPEEPQEPEETQDEQELEETQEGQEPEETQEEQEPEETQEEQDPEETQEGQEPEETEEPKESEKSKED